MPEIEQSMLFREFSRIKTDKTKNLSGSGLGLPILKKIVDLYHGTIDVNSRPDVGSEFHIKLPVICKK